MRSINNTKGLKTDGLKNSDIRHLVMRRPVSKVPIGIERVFGIYYHTQKKTTSIASWKDVPRRPSDGQVSW